jgi:hypothetical protein
MVNHPNRSKARVYDMHGRTVRQSKNLAGILTHYRSNPADIVVKVVEAEDDPSFYEVTFFWPNGDHGVTRWSDWRVLLDWLKARRSWSIARVTFDARIYDCFSADPRFATFRRDCAPLTRHEYQH